MDKKLRKFLINDLSKNQAKLIVELIQEAKKEVLDELELIKNTKGKFLLNQADMENQVKYDVMKKRHLPQLKED